MKIGSVIGVFFLLCGMGVHFIGFKVALQVRPDFARSLSGVVTFEELDALDASYKEQLVQLQEQLSKSLEKITELKTLKDRFADLATPAPVKSKFNEPSSGARGGPLKPFTFKVDANKSIDKNFSETVQSSKDLNQILTKFKNDWSQQYDWLNQLPIGIPVASQFGSMSSNYGMRVDPFTKNLAFHSGIDF